MKAPRKVHWPRIDPPIHTEYFLSGGATILICAVCKVQLEYVCFKERGAPTLKPGGASAVTSFWRRSAIPGYMVVPPERTMLRYRSRRTSRSHRWIALALCKNEYYRSSSGGIEAYNMSWIPADSLPIMEGAKRASGPRKLTVCLSDHVTHWNHWVFKIPLISNGKDLPIRQFVVFLNSRTLSSHLEFSFKIQGDIAQFLLDIADDFAFCRGCKGIATFCQHFDKMTRKISASKIKPLNSVRKRKSLIDGHDMGHAVPWIQDNSGCPAWGIQGQDSLNGDIESRRVECFEHDLGHLFPVYFGIQGRFRQKDRVLLRCDAKLIIESVVPNLLHVIPVGHDAMLDRVLEG